MVAGKVKVPVGTFRLRSGRTKGDEGLIYIRYFASGKYIERSTNIKVRESDWCKKSQRVLPSNKNHIRLNARLNTMKTQYDNQILSYKGIVTARMISQMLDGECYSKEDAASKVDFIKYCFDYYTRAAARGAVIAELPEIMNLGSDELADEYADTKFDVGGGEVITATPICHALTIPLSAGNPDAASEFAAMFLDSDFEKYGFVKRYKTYGEDIL